MIYVAVVEAGWSPLGDPSPTSLYLSEISLFVYIFLFFPLALLSILDSIYFAIKKVFTCKFLYDSQGVRPFSCAPRMLVTFVGDKSGVPLPKLMKIYDFLRLIWILFGPKVNIIDPPHL